MVPTARYACVLPNRVGDCILSLPAAATLALSLPAEAAHPLTVHVSRPLKPLLEQLDLPWRVKTLGVGDKLATWLQPYDVLVHGMWSSHGQGFAARHQAGFKQPGKRFLPYQQNLPFLALESALAELPPDLVTALHADRTTPGWLSVAALRYMGMGEACFGVALPEWLSTYHHQVRPRLVLPRLSVDHLPPHVAHLVATGRPYLTMCLEAGYGTRRKAARKWPVDSWRALMHELLAAWPGLSLVVVGLEGVPTLPEDPRVVDVRGPGSLLTVAAIQQYSRAYVGNDSGLLHLANLSRVPAVGFYLITDVAHYGAIHAPLITALEASDWRPIITVPVALKAIAKTLLHTPVAAPA
jgi:hypothetical protein